MKAFFIKNIIPITGALLGAAGGYAYWYFVGCQNGSCPIYSIWYRSTVYGAVMGLLLGTIVLDIVKPKKKKQETPD